MIDEVVGKLSDFFNEKGGKHIESNNKIPMGAATFHPEGTFFATLKQAPNTFLHFHQVCVRPFDGKFKDPLRSDVFCQYQVLISCDQGFFASDLFMESIKSLGFTEDKHAIEVIEDNWNAPSLGAFGLGWEVRVNGIEIGQVTYMQKMGGIALKLPFIELAYGVDRIAMILSKKESIENLFKQEKSPLRGEYSKVKKDFIDKYIYYSTNQLHDKICEKLSNNTFSKFEKLKTLSFASHLFNLLDSTYVLEVHERVAITAKMKQESFLIAKSVYDEEKLPILNKREIKVSKQKVDKKIFSDLFNQCIVHVCHERVPCYDLKKFFENFQCYVMKKCPDAWENFSPKLSLGKKDAFLIFGKPKKKPIRYIKGPAVNNLNAIEKFIKKHCNTDIEILSEEDIRILEEKLEGIKIEEIKGRNYLVFIKKIDLIEVIADLLSKFIVDFNKGNKVMRWNSSNLSFYRPLKIVRIVSKQCMYDIVNYTKNVFSEDKLLNDEKNCMLTGIFNGKGWSKDLCGKDKFKDIDNVNLVYNFDSNTIAYSLDLKLKKSIKSFSKKITKIFLESCTESHLKISNLVLLEIVSRILTKEFPSLIYNKESDHAKYFIKSKDPHIKHCLIESISYKKEIIFSLIQETFPPGKIRKMKHWINGGEVLAPREYDLYYKPYICVLEILEEMDYVKKWALLEIQLRIQGSESVFDREYGEATALNLYITSLCMEKLEFNDISRIDAARSFASSKNESMIFLGIVIAAVLFLNTIMEKGSDSNFYFQAVENIAHILYLSLHSENLYEFIDNFLEKIKVMFNICGNNISNEECELIKNDIIAKFALCITGKVKEFKSTINIALSVFKASKTQKIRNVVYVCDSKRNFIKKTSEIQIILKRSIGKIEYKKDDVLWESRSLEEDIDALYLKAESINKLLDVVNLDMYSKEKVNSFVDQGKKILCSYGIEKHLPDIMRIYKTNKIGITNHINS